MESSVFGPEIPQGLTARLTGERRAFAEVYLLEGLSIEESAKKVGISKSTAFAWLRDEATARAFHALAAARFIALETILMASVHRKGVQGSAAHAKLWMQRYGLLTERIEIAGADAIRDLIANVPLAGPKQAEIPPAELPAPEDAGAS